MAGSEAGGRNEPLPLLDEDWRQLRVMRRHLAHSAVFQEARRACTPEDIEQNAQDQADEVRRPPSSGRGANQHIRRLGLLSLFLHQAFLDSESDVSLLKNT